MYGIYSYIWLIFMVNVGKYTIHGSYGYMEVNPKMVGENPPNHPFVHTVFHDFHHPFWGTPILGNTHMWIYGTRTYINLLIYQKSQVNLGKYTSPMDGMGSFSENFKTCFWWNSWSKMKIECFSRTSKPASRGQIPSCSRYKLPIFLTHRIHVWCIYLHLGDFYSKCWQIYHTWILIMGNRNIIRWPFPLPNFSTVFDHSWKIDIPPAQKPVPVVRSQRPHLSKQLQKLLPNDLIGLLQQLTLRIQSPSRMMIGCIITSLERYLGSITILRRWLDP